MLEMVQLIFQEYIAPISLISAGHSNNRDCEFGWKLPQ